MRIQSSGLLVNHEFQASPGFTLFSPLVRDEVYLLNMQGEVVHEWFVKGNAYGYAYLLNNGNLLASALAPGTDINDRESMREIREIDWEGRVVWKCNAPAQHHDFVRLSNGNTAYLGFEKLSSHASQRVVGGIPGSEINGKAILGDYIREITSDGHIAWDWRGEDNMEIEKFPLHDITSREEFAHANSLFDLNGNGYLVSFRRSSLLFMIERTTKRVTWFRHEPH